MKKMVILSLLLSPLAIAEPVIKQEYAYYSVSADSKETLLASLNSASPIRENGEVFHGYTKYNIDWHFTWKNQVKRCQLDEITTTLQLNYTMPKLDSTNQEVQTVWSNWYPHLNTHEQGHGALAIIIAAKIDEGLHKMGARRDCKRLEDDANQLAYQLIAELNDASELYDEKTNHGETQKAWLYSHL